MLNFLKRSFNKTLLFKQFRVYYNNLESARQTIDEILNERPYEFSSNKAQPFIIDAGSNIGIATLFFKERAPQAKILCFEPDPNAFKWLQKNIASNKLNGVTLVNAAVSGQEGEINFFGQISVKNPDARGNSIFEAWGHQRKVNNTIKVKAVKLSSYIHEEVDFLKIDIEGAEQQVLEDLETEKKLSFIKEMAIEVHMTDKMGGVNDAYVIANLLKRNHFSITINEINIKNVLPASVSHWAKEAHPRLFVIRATRL